MPKTNEWQDELRKAIVLLCDGFPAFAFENNLGREMTRTSTKMRKAFREPVVHSHGRPPVPKQQTFQISSQGIHLIGADLPLINMPKDFRRYSPTDELTVDVEKQKAGQKRALANNRIATKEVSSRH